MSRGGREERESQEQEILGRILCSQGRSGGSNAPDPEADQPTPYVRRERSQNIQESERLDPKREFVILRDRSYRISQRELALMTEIGKFRTIAIADLAEYRYAEAMGPLRADISNLKSQKLICERRVMAGKGWEKFSVLVLAKEGKKLLQYEQTTPSAQSLYAGLAKPQEVQHDAAIYRMYQVEAEKIERQGGRIHRVVLDYELKKTIYSPLAKARTSLPPLEYMQRQAAVARANGLKVVEGKIPLPDLRIEYETSDGGLAKVDLEFATEHYHSRHAAEKLRAGFKTYADRASASRLNAALNYGRGSIYEGPELTAGILSL